MSTHRANTMSAAFEYFQRDFLHANTWNQRKDGVPLSLLDRLTPDERLLAEDQLIEAAGSDDSWPILGLGHLRSKKALPVLRALLEKCRLGMKIYVAFAIFQITGEVEMVDVVLEELPKINNEYALIDILWWLPAFRDRRITALLEQYTHDKRYLVAYNATRNLSRSTDEVIERYRKERKPPSWLKKCFSRWFK